MEEKPTRDIKKDITNKQEDVNTCSDDKKKKEHHHKHHHHHHKHNNSKNENIFFLKNQSMQGDFVEDLIGYFGNQIYSLSRVSEQEKVADENKIEKLGSKVFELSKFIPQVGLYMLDIFDKVIKDEAVKEFGVGILETLNQEKNSKTAYEEKKKELSKLALLTVETKINTCLPETIKENLKAVTAILFDQILETQNDNKIIAYNIKFKGKKISIVKSYFLDENLTKIIAKINALEKLEYKIIPNLGRKVLELAEDFYIRKTSNAKEISPNNSISRSEPAYTTPVSQVTTPKLGYSEPALTKVIPISILKKPEDNTNKKEKSKKRVSFVEMVSNKNNNSSNDKQRN